MPVDVCEMCDSSLLLADFSLHLPFTLWYGVGESENRCDYNCHIQPPHLYLMEACKELLKGRAFGCLGAAFFLGLAAALLLHFHPGHTLVLNPFGVVWC